VQRLGVTFWKLTKTVIGECKVGRTSNGTYRHQAQCWYATPHSLASVSANELISVLFYLISQDRPLASLKRERERERERDNSSYIKRNSALLMATANSRVARALSRLKDRANRSLTAAGRQQGGKGGERLIWSCPGEPTSQPSQISLPPPLLKTLNDY